MHRKDYIKAAQLIKDNTDTPAEREKMTKVFVKFFQDDNSRFDQNRFEVACEVEQ